MGNAQGGARPLAAFYAANGADVSKALTHLAGAQFRDQLCEMFGTPEAAPLVAEIVPNAVVVPSESATSELSSVEIKGAPSDAVSGGSVSGGAESFVGGFDDMQNYGNSMYSKAKENLIRAIAEDVFSSTNAKGAKDPRTAPISDVVNGLLKLFPAGARNAKNKFNKGFNSSSGAQLSLCKALARAINKHYAGALIDVEGDAGAMCDKIAEIMQSLLTGLNVEFMNIAGDVMRVMNNMRLARQYLDAAYNKQRDYIASTSDVRLKDMSSNTDEVYKAVAQEYDRQAAILSNLINISIGPTGKSIISSLEDNRDFSGLVKNLRDMVGTRAFGDKLSYLLSGVSSVAHSAELIDKALKRIGMSVAEFKSSGSAGELRAKVLKHIMGQHPTSKRLDELMAAARIIYEANYDHAAVSKALAGESKAKKSKRGGAEEEEDSSSSSESEDEKLEHAYPNATGGADDDLPAYWAKKSLSKKIANKQKYREMILKDFRKALINQYRNIIAAANQISKHIGNGIPYSDDLRRFVDVFGQIENIDDETIHVALSGYAKNSTNKERRELFMNKYDAVIRLAEPLTKGPMGNLFKNVADACRTLVKNIDDFSDHMVKAITEIHVDSPDEIAAALKKTASTFYGAGEKDSGSMLSNWVPFEKVQSEMKYMLSIVNVKSNLARSHDDLKSYADDYEQILGEEAAWLIDRIKNNYLAKIEQFPDNDDGAVPPIAVNPKYGDQNNSSEAKIIADALNAHAGAAAPAGQKKNARAVGVENLKQFWTFQMNAKVNMIKVAQAVDLYLKAFTDGIAKHPDSISSILGMLNEVDLVARWFNERSGDQLASLFEVFPAGVNNAGINVWSENQNSIVKENANLVTIPAEGSHYYNYIQDRRTANADNLPGNPFLGRSLYGDVTKSEQCKGIIVLSQKVVRSMRALENIISAFASVGSKFGDVEPLTKTFMTTGQMSAALCDYVAASAFATQFDPVSTRAGDSYAFTYKSATDAKSISGQNIPATAGGVNKYREQNLPDSSTVSTAPPAAGAPPAALATVLTYGILTGVSASNGPAGADVVALTAKKHSSVAIAGIPNMTVDFKDDKWKYHNPTNTNVHLDIAGWRDNFYDTDMIFTMVVKSIIAKIFTTVDAYRLFHRPVMDTRAHYSLNPLRTILGGADGGATSPSVKVIPEALELYYRLILLAEWYREQFGIKSESKVGQDDWRLSIVPSIDGIWSEFIGIVFDQASYVKEGNYSESQVQKLILAMNDIWKTYKSKYPASTMTSILNAFILEMNRTFGFLKQKEIDAYLNDRRSYLENPSGVGEQKNMPDQYDILNEKDQFGARPAPSDRFSKVSANAVAARKERSMVLLQQSIDELRRKIDADFLQHTQTKKDSLDWVHFGDTFKIHRNNLNNARDDLGQYRVVLQMIQGANRQVRVSSDNLIMVHELIATPLSVLYAVYKILARYNAMIHGTSIDNLKAFSKVRPDARADAAIKAKIDTAADARSAYQAFLEKIQYKKVINKNILNHFTRSMFGNGYCNIGALAQNVEPAGYINAQIAANAEIKDDNLLASKLVQDLITAILDFGTNSNRLVGVSVGAGGNINVDFSALEDCCKDLLQLVKDNAKKLRLHFAGVELDIVDRFEDANTVGSSRWIEENLMQVLFANRDECGLPHTLGMLNKTLQYLFKPQDNTAGRVAANLSDDKAQSGSVTDALASLLFYSVDTGVKKDLNRCYPVRLDSYPGNLMAFKREPTPNEEKDAVLKALTRNVDFKDDNEMKSFNNISLMPVIQYASANSINSYDLSAENKSLIFTFNRVLNMFMYTNVEDGNNKIYAPLIEQFATTAASLEIMQSKAFPDVTKQLNRAHSNDANNLCYTNERIGLPPKGTVVFASNAIPIKSLLTSVMAIGTAQKKKFIYDSLAEVPEYMKERMRTNLPFFSRIFGLIADRATMLQNILTMSTMNKNVALSASGAANVVTLTNGPGGVNILVPEIESDLINPYVNGMDSDAMSVYYKDLITRLIECTNSIRKCADSVYRELQDKPVAFLETSKEFLQDYRSRNGHIPVMPASSLLAPLGSVNGLVSEWKQQDGSHALLPVKENGSVPYKYNFATRLILARADIEPNLDHFPGAKDLYNSYANNQKSGITSQEYNASILHTVKLAKMLLVGSAYNKLFDKSSDIYYAPAHWSTNSMFSAVKQTERFVSDTSGAQLDDSTLDLVFSAQSAIEACNKDAASIAGIPAAAVRENRPIFKAHNAIVSVRSAVVASKFDNTGLKVGTDAANAPAAAGGGVITIQNAVPVITGIKLNEVAPLMFGVLAKIADAQKRKRLAILPFSDPNGMNGVIELTENANDLFSKERLALVISSTGESKAISGDRAKLRTLNILDAGLVPLNVHAFMREVPFVNILNYSYTFDRMAHDFILPTYIKDKVAAGGITKDNLMIMDVAGAAKNTRELLVKLLVHPHAKLDSSEYFDLLGSLFNGNDDMKLGRPRYLSDQLWHKVLLTSSVQIAVNQMGYVNRDTGNTFNANYPQLEAGPSAYEAVRKTLAHGRPVTSQIQVSMKTTDISQAIVPVATAGLKVWDATNKVWKTVAAGAANMPPGDVIYCAEIGRMRFDTKLVRNLVWFVQLQRIMRVVLTEHLGWISSPVVSGMSIADEKITEFNANERFDEDDFNGKRYDVV